MIFSLQVKNPIHVIFQHVNGASPDPMNWPVTSGNTPEPNRSAAQCVSAASPDLITWPSTPRGMNPKTKATALEEGRAKELVRNAYCAFCVLTFLEAKRRRQKVRCRLKTLKWRTLKLKRSWCDFMSNGNVTVSMTMVHFFRIVHQGTYLENPQLLTEGPNHALYIPLLVFYLFVCII